MTDDEFPTKLEQFVNIIAALSASFRNSLQKDKQQQTSAGQKSSNQSPRERTHSPINQTTSFEPQNNCLFSSVRLSNRL
ncbi:hypothetical protein DdX_09625 [Ditylenchus destructor]|uniref:Uncharacterized protein n=1 Tax=Ditylenchus destructor TaxID=166010 RepID=A0AAD4N3K9_9BILA|nr:hypothetical protein DdX_09625 [Ditylenchus destructor]